MASLADALVKYNMLGQDTRAMTVAIAPIFLTPPANRRSSIRVSGGLSEQISNLQNYSRKIISTMRAIAAEKIKQQTIIERLDRKEKENKAEMTRLLPERQIEKVEEEDNSDLIKILLRILEQAMRTIARIVDTITNGIRRIITALRGLLGLSVRLLRIVPLLIGILRRNPFVALGLAIGGAITEYRRQQGAAEQPFEIPRPEGETIPREGGPQRIRRPEGESQRVEPPSGDFGSLARRFESAGNPGAVGRDRNGGYSYGTYQIATQTGTMNDFMNWLRNRNPGAAEELDRAGGVSAATSGSPEFIDAWRRLSQNQIFIENQRQFISETHYRPAASNILVDTGVNVSTRSRALQEVVNSTAIQHGPAGARRIVSRAINEAGGSNASDEDIINRIYDIRSDVTREFRSSTPGEQESVRNRFIREREEALRMLQREPSTAARNASPRQTSVAPSISPSVQQAASFIPQQQSSAGLFILPIMVGA